MRPFYRRHGITIYHGDCRELIPQLTRTPAVTITDPPYGVTSLDWDRVVPDWISQLPGTQLWCFGSMRFFLACPFPSWTYAQEIIWHKHNGSGFHADRFRRVHELAVHFYRGAWAKAYHAPVYTHDATKRTIRRKRRPAHMGDIERGHYASEDGGPRLVRSIIEVRSCHGRARHPTEKPLDILTPLIEYSCPAGGLVFDPFMGSGSTLHAARQLGRQAIGIEINRRDCARAAERLG